MLPISKWWFFNLGRAFEYTTGMIKSLTTLLAFQALGELLALTLIPVMPGPVLGLILLFVYLVARKGPDAELAHTSSVFSAHLGLLFVPAAVGVVVFLPLLKDFAWPLIIALVASVVLPKVGQSPFGESGVGVGIGFGRGAESDRLKLRPVF